MVDLSVLILATSSEYQDTNFDKEGAEDKMKVAVKATKHHRRVLHTVTVFFWQEQLKAA